MQIRYGNWIGWEGNKSLDNKTMTDIIIHEYAHGVAVSMVCGILVKTKMCKISYEEQFQRKFRILDNWTSDDMIVI